MRRLAPALLVLLFAALFAALPATAQEQVESLVTEAGAVEAVRIAGGLDHPWGMAFLPDGRMLVTERPGRLRIVSADGTLSPPVAGTPTVYAQGQGGLLDVALDPDFGENGYVYLSYARPGPEGSAATAVGRARMQGDSLAGFEVLYTQEPYITGPNHFGSRIEFSPQGHLYLAQGERFQFDPAQNLGNHLGTIVRLNRDGSIPSDNPFVGDPNASDAIWSYGHRNIESAIVHPETGDLWVAEMGPLGGDELNLIEPGRNYGWPVVSWGMHYDGDPIPDPPTRPEFADAVKHWSPVISPSGMTVYVGERFPEWTGSVMIGSLSRLGVVRLVIEDRAVAHEEIIPLGARIREVAAGPDGYVYVLTDQTEGDLLRLQPMDE
jgi:glucose/arabinose dehydrogenase